MVKKKASLNWILTRVDYISHGCCMKALRCWCHILCLLPHALDYFYTTCPTKHNQKMSKESMLTNWMFFSSGYEEINYFSHWLYNLDWQIWNGKMLPVVSGGEQIWATSPSAIKDVLCILLIVCQTSKFSSCAKAYQKISLTSFGVEVRTEKTKEKIVFRIFKSSL